MSRKCSRKIHFCFTFSSGGKMPALGVGVALLVHWALGLYSSAVMVSSESFSCHKHKVRVI